MWVGRLLRTAWSSVAAKRSEVSLPCLCSLSRSSGDVCPSFCAVCNTIKLEGSSIRKNVGGAGHKRGAGPGPLVSARDKFAI